MGHVATGQIAFFDRGTVDDVGQRHFGGRDQPPAIGGLIAILAKFRQLACAAHHVFFDQNWGPGLGQLVFIHVYVQHKLGQRAVQAGNGARQNHEARARQLRGGFEVQTILNGGQLIMLNRLEREFARGAPAVDLDIVVFVVPIWHVIGHDVGQAHQKISKLGVQLFRLLIKAGDLGFLLADQCTQTLELGLVARGFCRPNGLGRLVGFRLCGFGGQNGGAAVFIQRQNLARQFRKAPTGHSLVERFGVVADQADIMHGSVL